MNPNDQTGLEKLLKPFIENLRLGRTPTNKIVSPCLNLNFNKSIPKTFFNQLRETEHAVTILSNIKRLL